MKRMFMVVLLALCAGCSNSREEASVVKINTYAISPQEFEVEFRESAFGRQNTMEARKQFLDTLVNRKLIMQDAEKLGIDKEVDFLKSIERYWEQMLLKAYLDRKGRELAGKVQISDAAVEQAYKKLSAEGKTELPYDQMYQQLKWQLTRDKESQLMNEWVDTLRRRAVIKEDLSLLEVN